MSSDIKKNPKWPGSRSRSFALRRTFAALRERNYRLYFTGQLVSIMGSWLQTTALAFLVLHLAHSGTVLGLTMAAQYLPVLLLTPVGGLAADRLNKRRVQFVTQTMLAALAGALAVLVTTHVIELWMIYVISANIGVVSAFNAPARQSFLSEMVPADTVANAVSLNSVSVNVSRVFGAALGGVLVTTLGFSVCFGLNALSFLVVVGLLLMMHAGQLRTTPPLLREKSQIRIGLRYVRKTPELLVPLTMIAVIGTLAYEFPVTLPLLVTTTFHRSAATYGLMASVMAGGAVIGGLVATWRSKFRARSMSVAAMGWGISIVCAALARNIPEELVAMVFVGYGNIMFNSIAKTALQLASIPEMRGRVMALWSMAWSGSTVIGGPLVGWVAKDFGARWSLIIGGFPTVLIGLAAYSSLKRIDERAVALAANNLIIDAHVSTFDAGNVEEGI